MTERLNIAELKERLAIASSDMDDARDRNDSQRYQGLFELVRCLNAQLREQREEEELKSMAKLRPTPNETQTEPDSIEDTLARVKAMVRSLVAERESLVAERVRLLERIAELEGRK